MDFQAKMPEQLPNPVDLEQSLKRSIDYFSGEQAHPPTSQPIPPEDSAVTEAEKTERNGVNGKHESLDVKEPAAKRVKMDDSVEAIAVNATEEKKVDSRDKVKGIALVKTE